MEVVPPYIYMYIYIYIYVCMYVFAYQSVYVCLYVCMFESMHVCTLQQLLWDTSGHISTQRRIDVRNSFGRSESGENP